MLCLIYPSSSYAFLENWPTMMSCSIQKHSIVKIGDIRKKSFYSVFWKQCLITSPENKIITIPMKTKLMTRNIKSPKSPSSWSNSSSVSTLSGKFADLTSFSWSTLVCNECSIPVLFWWRRCAVTFLTLRDFSASKSSLRFGM